MLVCLLEKAHFLHKTVSVFVLLLLVLQAAQTLWLFPGDKPLYGHKCILYIIKYFMDERCFLGFCIYMYLLLLIDEATVSTQ